MKKTINVGDKRIPFEASADTPRAYRMRTGRDLIKDMLNMSSNPDDIDMDLFENVAFVMAQEADSELKEMELSEWLKQFEMFDLISALPEIVKLWTVNMKITSKSGKKRHPQ